MAALDVLRSPGPDASTAATTLATLLPHRCALYKERDKLVALRLRAYIMLTLSDVGVPPEAVPPLLEALAQFDGRMNAVEIGAAARAVGTLGHGGRAFAPYLMGAMSEPLAEEEFTLVRYEQVFTPEEATTIQIEVIHTLGLVCTTADVIAMERLRSISRNTDPGADPRATLAAAAAVERIESTSPELRATAAGSSFREDRRDH